MKIIEHNGLKMEPVSHDPDIMKQVILRNGDADNITQASKATFRPGQRTAPHIHPDMTEIYTLHRGTARLTVAGKTSDAVGPATIVIHPGEMHSLANESDSDIDLHYIGVIAKESAGD